MVADFDGTVTLHDVTTAILDRFARPSWRSIEAEWEAGLIGSRECMARQVALIRADIAELDDFVARTPVDPFFAPFVADCRLRRIAVCLASDGLDRVITAVLSRIGLGDLPFTANHLMYEGRRRWRLSFPHARDVCPAWSGNCKCAAGMPGPVGARVRTIVIGDGRSDLCAAAAADYVFAKNQLLALCRARGIVHRPFSTFEDAARLLGDLVDNETTVPPSARAEETTYA